MNGFVVKTKKISCEEAKNIAIEHFADWYTSGVVKEKIEYSSFQRKMKRIKENLKFYEFCELIFSAVLKSEEYEIVFSNIHTKNGNHPSLGVDIFVIKEKKKAFFVEVKGSEPESSPNIKSRFSEANRDIDKRLSNIDESIDDMGLKIISSENYTEFENSGIACVAALVSANSPLIPKENKYTGYFVEINLSESLENWKANGKK